MNKGEKIKICAWMVLAGFTFSVFIHYALHWYFKQDYPLATFLCVPSEVWSDFLGCTVMNATMDPFHTLFRGFGNNYPPAGYLGIATFTQFGYVKGSFIYAGVFLLGFWAFMFKNMRIATDREGLNAICIFILCLLTYPFLFAFDRLNTENMIFLLVAAFYMLMKKNTRDNWASICLGAAAAMKVYPGIFILAFINKKRWRPLLYVGVTALIVTAIAMTVFHIGPKEMMERYAASAPSFISFTIFFNGIQHSTSLFATVRTIQFLYNVDAARDAVDGQHVLHLYNVCATILALIIASGFFSQRLRLWEKLTLALVIILAIPPVSFDYKLLYVFIPLMAFFDAPTERREGWVFAILFSILLIPKAFIVFFVDVSLEALVNPPVLLIMAGLLLWKAWGIGQKIGQKAVQKSESKSSVLAASR